MHVELNSLGHRFDGQPWLFRGLTHTLNPGEVYSLSGPSGSGKSTLLGIIAQWIRPAEGDVDLGGITSTGWVFQSPHGVAKRASLDHITLPLMARGASRDDAEKDAVALLKRFGLGERVASTFKELSGGEAQRLMLARAMATRSDLLLVDEPTAQLDRATSLVVSEAISQLAHSGSIVVVATHDEATRQACTAHIDLTAYAAPSEAHGS